MFWCTSLVILVTVSWSVVRIWIKSNNLKTSRRERSSRFKKVTKIHSSKFQIIEESECYNQNWKKIRKGKIYIRFNITSSSSGKTITPFSCNPLASSLHDDLIPIISKETPITSCQRNLKKRTLLIPEPQNVTRIKQWKCRNKFKRKYFQEWD